MPKVVLDTNVIVSALHFGGNPDKVLNLANERTIELLVSPFILDEVDRVLLRFGWSEKAIKNVLLTLQEIATLIHPTHNLSVIKGKDSDNRILECAVSGQADFIVSGDTKHILPLKEFQGIKMLKPAEFLNLKF